jgi:hypothetical protein
MNGACAQILALLESLAQFRAHARLSAGPHSVHNGISDEDGEEAKRLTSLRVIRSQVRLNSRPSTKLGSVISRRPNMRIGTVIRRPRKERGVISPYPTVVIAVGNVMIFDLRMNG